MAAVDLVTTGEALDRWFLPWQVLLAERLHLPWQHPKWWQVCRDSKDVDLPYWAMVESGGRLIGMVPLQRNRIGSQHFWNLDLTPLAGGGVIGGQTTAVLNAVIQKLTADPKRQGWNLAFDPSDVYLKNRFELAFHHARLLPRAGRPVINGWKLEAKSQAVANAVVQQNTPPEDAEILWWQSGISTAKESVAVDRPMRVDDCLAISDFDQIETVWFQIDKELWIGAWDVSSSRVLGGQEVFTQVDQWMPCCVAAGRNSQANISATSVVAGLLKHMEQRVQGWLLPESFHSWLVANRRSEKASVSWPEICLGTNVLASRWMMSQRSFKRPSLWQKMSGAASF